MEPKTEFNSPSTYCDYNILTLVAYNMETGEHKAIRSGHYESVINWTRTEQAMHSGEIKLRISSPNEWFFALETYPKPRCTVYCHPDALAKAIPAPTIELSRRHQIVLFLTRSTISTYRLEEARRFKFTKLEWEAVKTDLIGKKLMRGNGSLTTEGKNVAIKYNFNAWEENK